MNGLLFSYEGRVPWGSAFFLLVNLHRFLDRTS